MGVLVTGIKPTGEPHLGNLLGMLRPTLALAEAHEAYVFVPDLHALNPLPEPAALRARSRLVARLLVALGFAERGAAIYRQSDVPEIDQLTHLIAAVTPKGLLNRAHAYKAAVEANRTAGRDADAGVNAGLYGYPLLMAADVLALGGELVPVGRDQLQHVEMMRDVGEAFNARYGPTLAVPQPLIGDVPTLPGLDGRKMSKSYGNVIPLLAAPDELRRLIRRVRTDSRPPEEPKEPEGDTLFALYAAFATPGQAAAMAARYRAGGLGYGEVKDELATLAAESLAPVRERVAALDGSPEVEEVLREGRDRARERAAPVVAAARRAVGLD